ncbi:MAG: ROK family protein [Alphaproteobacteria bacterium]|nr:ROK family protein [Alphaproteobacteria bacterium]
MSLRIGIDFGGTKTEIICLDARNGKELYRQRVPTARGDYAGTVKVFAGLVTQAEETLKMKGTVGIGIPGTVTPETGLVKNANSTWIIGKPLQKDISEALGREVRMENDANCFAVSEATDGAGEGRELVFGVIIGTGCGGGIAVGGQAHRGLNSIGGEWGHNPLPYPRVAVKDAAPLFGHFEQAPEVKDRLENHYFADLDTSEYPGPLCYCGRRGCLETWISGTGFKNDYKRVTGESLSTHDIIANAHEGEEKAKAALARYIDRLSRALAQMTNILDPDVIVLGGGMSNVKPLYEEVPKTWGKYVFSDTVKTPILPAQHGDSSGVRGAAWLWGREEKAA